MADEGSLFEEGLAIRRAVLGEAYVEQALERATEFGAPLQKLVTEYCWGTIWNRPGLDHQMRSLANIAMLSALNRQHEVVLHVKGALRNGCSLEQIREVILQVAVFGGVPAALDANRSAEIAIQEYSEEAGSSGDAL
jgi:4-carboxymuconolactone decarboxylase